MLLSFTPPGECHQWKTIILRKESLKCPNSSLPVQRGTRIAMYNHQSLPICLCLSVSLTSRLMAKNTPVPPQHTRESVTTAAGQAYGNRSTKAIPLPCLLHKSPDDIQTGSGRVGLKNKEEGERRRRRRGHREQRGEQQKGRKRREGESCRSTGSQQIDIGEAELK